MNIKINSALWLFRKPFLFVPTILISMILLAYFSQGRLILNTSAAEKMQCTSNPTEIIGQKADPKRYRQLPKQLETKNSSLLQAKQKYSSAQSTDKTNLKNQLLNNAEERKTLLIELMRDNPDEAFAAMLEPQEARDIQNIFDNCVEQETTIEGTLEVLHADFLDATSKDYYSVTTEQKEKIQIHPSGRMHTALISGMKLKVKGVLIDHDLLFNSENEEASAIVPDKPLSFVERIIKKAYAAIPDAQGEQKVVVLLANFQNTTEPPLTNEAVQTAVFADANNHYAETSYNKVSLTGNTFGWYTLPINQTCNTVTVQTEAIKAAEADVDFSQYGRLIILAPLGPACSFSGVGTIGKSPVTTNDGVVSLSTAWVVLDPSSSIVPQYSIEHEFGHNLGVHHASFFSCGNNPINSPSCVKTEYGDLYSVMGLGKAGTHMNAPHTDYLGWFNPENIQTISESGTYVLEPLELPSFNLKAIKIPRGANDYLYLEYRQPLGYDVGLNTDNQCPGTPCPMTIYQGGLLHSLLSPIIRTGLIDPSPPSSARDIALLVGQTFTDPVSGTSITVTDRTATALTVDVTYVPPDTVAPTVAITQPGTGSWMNGTVTVTTNASDNVGVARVEFYANNLLKNTDSAAPFTWTWDTTTEQCASCTFSLIAKAFDHAGNAASSSPVMVSLDRDLPNVSVSAPANASQVSGNVTVSAPATDTPSGISKVAFYIDNVLVSEDTSTPFSTIWNTTNLVHNSTHSLFAKAFDHAENSATSSSTSVTVLDTLAPSVNITSPLSGSFINANTTVAISATASDISGITKVEFSVDTTLRCTDTTAPYSCSWVVPSKKGKVYALKAKAYDSAANTTLHSISVTSK